MASEILGPLETRVRSLSDPGPIMYAVTMDTFYGGATFCSRRTSYCWFRTVVRSLRDCARIVSAGRFLILTTGIVCHFLSLCALG